MCVLRWRSCPATAVLVKPNLCPAAHASADCCANRGHLTPTLCWGPGSPHSAYSFPLSSRFLPLHLFNRNSNRSFHEDDGKTLKIYMAREDLANLSNMTTANAIRTLSTFAQERIITVDGRRIRIVDESTLRNISRFG